MKAELLASVGQMDLVTLNELQEAITERRRQLEPRRFTLGQVVVVKWADGKRYHAVLTGGGQKCHAWFPSDGSHWHFEWSRIIEWCDGQIVPTRRDIYRKQAVPVNPTEVQKKYANEFNGF